MRTYFFSYETITTIQLQHNSPVYIRVRFQLSLITPVVHTGFCHVCFYASVEVKNAQAAGPTPEDKSGNVIELVYIIVCTST